MFVRARGAKPRLTHPQQNPADGKTLTVNVKGIDAQGKPVDAIVV